MGQYDEYEQAERDRTRLLAIPCEQCGRGPGRRCVDAGGHQLSINRQHAIRYRRARVDRGLLRALLVKAGLV